jgi:two-component system, OmpR family, response regulator
MNNKLLLSEERGEALDVYKVDTENYALLVNGEEANLSKTEYLLAKYLIENSHRVVSREEIRAKVFYRSSISSTSRSVDVYVGYLRKKLGREVIATKRSWGYRWAGQVKN